MNERAEHRFRVARRWKAASAADFLLAAIAFFAGLRLPGAVMIAAGLFAQYAAWRWTRDARLSKTAGDAWDWLEGR